MRSLALLRHAKAVPQADDADDRGRPLAARGERDTRTIAGWLAAQGPPPELALCSPALRTRQTLALLLPALVPAPRPVYDEALYLADATTLLLRLRAVAAATERVLLVGHNPGLHELAAALAGGTGGAARRLADTMPTAALACFEVSGSWAEFDARKARLAAYITPKELRK